MLTPNNRAKAQQIQQQLSVRLDAIRADSRLTEREQKRQMARMVLAAQDQLRGIHQSAEDADSKARSRAHMAAFGIDQSRAAEERALRAGLAKEIPGPVEVAARLQHALSIGDHLEAKVLGAYAWDRRHEPLGGDAFKDVINAYAGISPSVHQRMAELVALDEGIGDSGAARMQRLQDKLVVEVQVPPEIAGGSLDQWAASDNPEPAPAMGMPWGNAG